ncbi:hypothetical protein ACJJIF_02665 [Microbulbifer sp. SSSA002]|uniref:hypothetical protein n=1 Tax=unclassified Microbulbifer TaxID=2619833 RepID=UPI0040398A82
MRTLSIFHRVFATIAMLLITSFLAATVVSEFIGSIESILLVKKMILWPGLIVLVPAIAITGATGSLLSRGRVGDQVSLKSKRMRIVAINGLIFLIPCAFILEYWSSAGFFDFKFYLVQGLELLIGATNLGLMLLNFRDGLILRGGLNSLKPIKN